MMSLSEGSRQIPGVFRDRWVEKLHVGDIKFHSFFNSSAMYEAGQTRRRQDSLMLCGLLSSQAADSKDLCVLPVIL